MTIGRGRGRITAIENKFPVFVRGKGASGYQEILIEGERIRPFAVFTPREIEMVLRAYVARANAIRNIRGLKSLIIFKNEGREAGASQPHPHSQLFALSFVPRRVRRKNVSPEKIDPKHLIWGDKNAVVCAHPFARFPYEARMMTRRRIDNLTQASLAELRSLAKALHICLALVRKRKLAFNFFFHDVFQDAHEHFEMRFVPRANVWGGFELDAGIAVNPVTAEQAAAEYRSAQRQA